MGSFDILTDLSEHVTLVQLMDSLGNANNSISVVGYWIFDSNYVVVVDTVYQYMRFVQIMRWWSSNLGH